MRAPGVLYKPKLEMFPALRWPCFSLTLLALRIASYSRRHIRTIVYGMCLHETNNGVFSTGATVLKPSCDS